MMRKMTIADTRSWAWVALGACFVVATACDESEGNADGGPDGSMICSGDGNCDDGLFCNGTEACTAGSCQAGTPPCGPGTACNEDADACGEACSAPDADGDGHEAVECGGDDCDDTDANRFPGNVEVCDDGHDEDCDPSTFGSTDADGDGEVSSACCNMTAAGASSCGADCDDSTIARRQGQIEICDGIDNDCDDTVDEEMNDVPWYADEDGDLFGDGAAATIESCTPISGRSLVGTDCDDSSTAINPLATETCDGIDNDCDGATDEGCDMDGGTPPTDGGTPPGLSELVWDSSFAMPGAPMPVTDIAVDGERTYVAGEAPPYLGYLEGGVWTSIPGVDSAVDAIAVISGNVYIGGRFTMVDDRPMNGVAHWNGSTWFPVGPGVGGGVAHVTSLDADGTTLWVGGNFDTAGGLSTPGVASFETTTETWSGTNGGLMRGGSGPSISDITVAPGEGSVYVVGQFDTAGGEALAVQNIAVWDGSAWSSLGTTGSAGRGSAVEVIGTDVYVADGASLKRFDGSSWASVNRLADGTTSFLGLSTLAAVDGTLYAAAIVEKTSGNESVILQLSGGSLSAVSEAIFRMEPDYQPFRTGQVRALAASGTSLLVGGAFHGVRTETDAVISPNLLRRDPTLGWRGTGCARQGMAAGLQADLTRYHDVSTVSAIALDGSSVFVGGSFSSAGCSTAVQRVARWDGSAWHALGGETDDAVAALAMVGTTLVAAGPFTTIGGAAAPRLARWDGSAWSAFGSGPNDLVSVLTAAGSALYAGGSFTSIDGTFYRYVARWDGSAWSALGPGLNGPVRSIAVDGSDVYVAGEFTGTYDGTTSLPGGVARWDGSSWSALGEGPGGTTVSGIAAGGGEVFALVDVSTWEGGTVMRWDGSAWTDSIRGGGAPIAATALSSQGGRVLAGNRNFVHEWDGSAWHCRAGFGSQTLSVEGGAPGAVTKLASDADQVLVGLTGSGRPMYPLFPLSCDATCEFGSCTGGLLSEEPVASALGRLMEP